MKTKLVLLALTLAFTANAQAASYQYSCAPDQTANDSGFGTLRVELSATSITITDTGDNLTATGAINAAYRPHAANANKVQFQGLDDLSSEEYIIRALVDKTMLRGAASGELSIQASGEGYFGGYFKCTRE